MRVCFEIHGNVIASLPRPPLDLGFVTLTAAGGTVVRSESVRNIIRERRMLEHLNHPFICNLRYSFQDIEYLYVCTLLSSNTEERNDRSWLPLLHNQ